MAFCATLNIDGKEFDILYCKYKLSRDVDTKGRPESRIYGGTVRIHIESSEDTTILEKMIEEFDSFSGSIIFKKDNEDAKMKELSWENGYIIDFEEELDAKGSQPMAMAFVVSSQILKIGKARIQQNWPE